ncbi:MAG TPA: serine hydrolase domain-containing protein [Gaiellaceae bacterium]|nr:serine hydrolase domain-containing protein [Gaiellaceae bacterium]
MSDTVTPEPLAAKLARLVRAEQREKRLPSLAAAVFRDGERVWETAVGAADVAGGVEATPDTQYRLGSITKTFTAAAIMQLRDAGELDLEDTLDRFVPGAPHTPSLRRLLSHASGLQRETHDDSWLTLRFAPPDELVETLARAEQVLAPGARFHYSNLAYALLGVVVERVSGMRHEDYVRERLFAPLGLERTTFEPQAPAARGYLVQPYSDDVWDTVPVETGAWAAAGQLWGTVRDLCRWGAFLGDPDEAVLARKTVEEMRTVQVIDDHERWTAGYGLGLGLRRDRERILAGHSGSMPGFIARLYVSPAEKIGAATLTNESEATLDELTLKLVAATVEEWPVAPEPWRSSGPPPDDVAPLLGIWFLEASAIVFRWRDGRLEGRYEGMPDWRPSSVFEREGDDRWRTVSGPEHGEALRVERGPDGSVVRMVWAGYPVTREPGPWRAPDDA